MFFGFRIQKKLPDRKNPDNFCLPELQPAVERRYLTDNIGTVKRNMNGKNE